MSQSTLFVTGASGYVGRRLLQRLDPEIFNRVVCLVRSASRAPQAQKCVTAVSYVVGDLLEPVTYLDALADCDTVLHLAACTGKSTRAGHFRVNHSGTERLVMAATEAGVERFLHVSTIAAGFPLQSHYAYAQSKRQAEQVVRTSGISHTILRPTMVVGPDAPVLAGLQKIASLPVMPVFGDGRVQVQPIFVDDLADLLLFVLSSGRFQGETIEAGGPSTMPIEELLWKIREARTGKRRRSLHLPLRPIQELLALVERPLLSILPLTAGQLATFANDGTCAPHDLIDSWKERMTPMDVVLQMPRFPERDAQVTS